MRKRLKKKRRKKLREAYEKVVYHYRLHDEVIMSDETFDHCDKPFTADDFKKSMEAMLEKPMSRYMYYSASFAPVERLDLHLRCVCDDCEAKRAAYVDWREGECVND